jgi:hypothetical protein
MVGHQPNEKVARHLEVVFLDGARNDEQLDVVGPRAPYAPSASTSTMHMRTRWGDSCPLPLMPVFNKDQD